MVTEGKEVKAMWQQYTEELYRKDPNATDSFNENKYEDEPEATPIEHMKAGGEEAVKVMTGLRNCIWMRKE